MKVTIEDLSPGDIVQVGYVLDPSFYETPDPGEEAPEEEEKKFRLLKRSGDAAS